MGSKEKQTDHTRLLAGGQSSWRWKLGSERKEGGRGGRKVQIAPLGSQVRAGRLLLGVSGRAAELVQHSLIPASREGETVRQAEPAPKTPQHPLPPPALMLPNLAALSLPATPV